VVRPAMPRLGYRRAIRRGRQLSGRSLDPVSNAGARGMIAVPRERDTEFGLQACPRFCISICELPKTGTNFAFIWDC
jgi:hypothetical protein